MVLINDLYILLNFICFKLPSILYNYIRYPNIIIVEGGSYPLLILKYKLSYYDDFVYTIEIPIVKNNRVFIKKVVGIKKSNKATSNEATLNEATTPKATSNEATLNDATSNEATDFIINKMGPNLDFYGKIQTPNDLGFKQLDIITSPMWDEDEEETFIFKELDIIKFNV